MKQESNKKFIYKLVFILLFAISACASTPTLEEFQKYSNDPQALRVVAQICIPNKTTYFDTLNVDVTDLPANLSRLQIQKLFQDAIAYKAGEGFTNPYRSVSTNREYQTARLWRKPVNLSDYSQEFVSGGAVENVKGVKSAGSGAEYLIDSTEKNQPVFLAHLNERPEDILAVSVMPPEEESGGLRKFWFKLPKGINKDKFTPWMSPVSEENMKNRSERAPIFVLLTHGKPMPIYEVKDSKNVPKVRYSLMTMDEYDKYSQYGRRAMNAAHLQFMVDNPLDNESKHYVPAKRENIPPC
jgi:hypothetical protein